MRPGAVEVPATTLVVAPNWVGDNIMAIPVLEALAGTGRSLTVLARPHLEPLLGLIPAVDRVLARSKSPRETMRRLRQPGFEEAVILPNSFRSAWTAFRAGIPVRWGYRGDLRSLLLEPALARPAGQRHQVSDYDALLERMGVALPAGSPRLELAPSRLEEGRRRLRDLGLGQDGSLATVGVFPGAEFGPSKRWPPGRFSELLRELGARPEIETVLVAGPTEGALAAEVVRGSGVAAPVLGPELDLAQLAAVLAALDVLITNDSGPMHVAAATGAPCLALFGPTSPDRTSPVGAHHRVLYTKRWCSPCYKKRCPLIHQRCMRDLGVGRVLSAMAEVLDPEARDRHSIS